MSSPRRSDDQEEAPSDTSPIDFDSAAQAAFSILAAAAAPAVEVPPIDPAAPASSQRPTAAPSDVLPPPPPSTNAQPEPPRVPWTGRIPAFFQVGPDGTLIPHFPGFPQRPSTPGNPSPDRPNNDGPAGNVDHHAMPHFHLPNFPAGMQMPPFFPFMMPMSGLRDRRPDPEAAAELLRSLPAVEKALFKRVERVVVAEQVQNDEAGEEQGWKCGICLEGVDNEAKETGVKVLPCNHLFHCDCLEPWFATNHTCPTCRLDLDPLKTLGRHRGASGRPGATGSGRSTPHPYARPGNATPPRVGIAPGGPGEGSGPSITMIWQMPVPPDLQPTPPAASGDIAAPHPTVPPGDSAVGPDRPQTPTLRFDFPLSTSPLPMNRARSVSPMTRSDSPIHGMVAGSPSTVSPGQGAPGPSGDSIPHPQPRRHITVIHHHHGPPSAPGSPHHHHHVHVHPGSPHHHHHHHHHLRPPGASTPVPTPATLPSNVAASVVDDTNLSNAAANGPATASPDSRGPATPADQGGSNNGGSNRPHFHFFFNLTSSPTGLPLPTGVETDVPPPAGSPAPTAQPAEPVKGPSLTEWVTAREKVLGWRCDAPECGVAPVDDGEEDSVMPAEGDKEMLSIYSTLQPATTEVTEPVGAKGFELHSCEHRWHRSCLETTERSAGRSLRPDEEGKVAVRCEACRKEGWIRPRPRSMSEGEVERLCVGR